MQEKFKKAAAGAVGLLTAGATLAAGFAGVAFGTDLSDFAAGNVFTTENTIVVVGPNAAMADNVGAINIGAKLAQAGATYTGTSAAATAPGVVALDTATTKIYKGSLTNAAKETLTKDNLPTLLTSGSMVDADDNSYAIDQYITVGNATLDFTNADDSSKDPSMKVLYGTDINTPLYTLKASFETIPINNSVGKKVTLFGKDFTVSSDTTAEKLYLYGSASDVSLTRGETVTVTIGGVEHTIKLVAVTSGTVNDKITVEVDGSTDDVTEGSSKKINGVSIYADRVSAYQEVVDGVALNSGSASLMVGSQKLVFEAGAAVQTGDSTLTDIDGTMVKINSATTGLSAPMAALSTIEVVVFGESDAGKVVKNGDSYVDPVFGSMKYNFAGLTPAADDSRTTTTKVTRATKEGKVTFTDRNGVEKTTTFAYDTLVDGTQDALLQYDADSKISTHEGQVLAKDDLVVLNSNRFSHLFKITKIQNKTSTTTRYVSLQDMYSSTNYDVEIDASTGTKVIDGATYTFTVSTCTGYTCTGVTITDSTTGTAVFPTLIGNNGEAMAFTNKTEEIAINNVNTIVLPSGSLTLSLATTAGNLTATEVGVSSNVITIDNGEEKNITVGKVDYNMTFSTTANTTTLKLTAAENHPAVLFYAYDKNVNSATTDLIHYVVAADSDTGSGTAAKFEVKAPMYASAVVGTYRSTTFAADQKSLQTDTDKVQLIDRYGTDIVYDSSSDAEYAEIKYPAAQVYANLYIAEVAVETPSASTSDAIAHLSLTADGVARLASDASVAADKLEKNVVLVGGPAINSLVEELATAEKTPDVTYYRDETKEGSLKGKALIQVIDNAFADGMAAIVVSGYEAAQTRAASLKLATEALSGAAVVIEASEASAYDFEAYKAANAAAAEAADDTTEDDTTEDDTTGDEGNQTQE